MYHCSDYILIWGGVSPPEGVVMGGGPGAGSAKLALAAELADRSEGGRPYVPAEPHENVARGPAPPNGDSDPSSAMAAGGFACWAFEWSVYSRNTSTIQTVAPNQSSANAICNQANMARSFWRCACRCAVRRTPGLRIPGMPAANISAAGATTTRGPGREDALQKIRRCRAVHGDLVAQKECCARATKDAQVLVHVAEMSKGWADRVSEVKLDPDIKKRDRTGSVCVTPNLESIHLFQREPVHRPVALRKQP